MQLFTITYNLVDKTIQIGYNKLLNRIQSFLYLHNLPTISIY